MPWLLLIPTASNRNSIDAAPSRVVFPSKWRRVKILQPPEKLLFSTSTQTLLCFIVIYSCGVTARCPDQHCIFPVLPEPEKTSSTHMWHSKLLPVWNEMGRNTRRGKRRARVRCSSSPGGNPRPGWPTTKRSSRTPYVSIFMSASVNLSRLLSYTHTSAGLYYRKKNKAVMSFRDLTDFLMSWIANGDWWRLE